MVTHLAHWNDPHNLVNVSDDQLVGILVVTRTDAVNPQASPPMESRGLPSCYIQTPYSTFYVMNMRKGEMSDPIKSSWFATWPSKYGVGWNMAATNKYVSLRSSVTPRSRAVAQQFVQRFQKAKKLKRLPQGLPSGELRRERESYRAAVPKSGFILCAKMPFSRRNSSEDPTNQLCRSIGTYNDRAFCVACCLLQAS
jgi:hypothetical protein